MESPVVPLNRQRLVRDFSMDDFESTTRQTSQTRPETFSRSRSQNEVYAAASEPRSPLRSPSRESTPRSPPPQNLRDAPAQNYHVHTPTQEEELRKMDFNLETIEERSSYAPSILSQRTEHTSHTGISGSSASRMADFFSNEVFQTVLHNPTTSHQLLRFSRSRLCGENMEFLEKVEKYYLLLNEVTKTIYDIHKEYISVSAPQQINISESLLLQLNKDLKSTLTTALPKMESVFTSAQHDIERLVEMDIYPRFVRHQMTMSASKALGKDRHKYAGLGDCFVLTDPGKADNPIVFASDGFVKVTGYTRQEIIPRNCRFLQGRRTDREAVNRLRNAIGERKESVELLLNFKKNGEPFWNLLYTTPLFDMAGNVAFFLGGQINCSTTIHNNSDIIRILSYSEDVEQDTEVTSPAAQVKSRNSFFKSFLGNPRSAHPARTPGMEDAILEKIGDLNLKKQMDTFYTAYSRYLIINYTSFLVSFYSAGITDLLHPSGMTKNAQSNVPIQNAVGMDIFKFLAQYTSTGKLSNEFKTRVRDRLKMGQPIGLDLTLCTRRYMGFESFVLHWTPLKDAEGAVKWAVCTLGSVNA